ncbi:hypothetical protein REPUB_Repub04eG0135400 [Reevesia pubescens]
MVFMVAWFLNSSRFTSISHYSPASRLLFVEMADPVEEYFGCFDIKTDLNPGSNWKIMEQLTLPKSPSSCIVDHWMRSREGLCFKFPAFENRIRSGTGKTYVPDDLEITLLPEPEGTHFVQEQFT